MGEGEVKEGEGEWEGWFEMLEMEGARLEDAVRGLDVLEARSFASKEVREKYKEVGRRRWGGASRLAES